MSSIYDIEVKTIDGRVTTMGEFSGKTLLIVNTASKCGYTPQYEGLNSLYKQYKDKGLVVLGFPCNQFMNQEPGDEAAIVSFCELNYKIEFPMFAKIDVNGADAHPLYKFLKQEAPGIFGTEGVKWNFTKFLVGSDGKVLKRYGSNDTPADIGKEIEKHLR